MAGRPPATSDMRCAQARHVKYYDVQYADLQQPASGKFWCHVMSSLQTDAGQLHRAPLIQTRRPGKVAMLLSAARKSRRRARTYYEIVQALRARESAPTSRQLSRGVPRAAQHNTHTQHCRRAWQMLARWLAGSSARPPGRAAACAGARWQCARRAGRAPAAARPPTHCRRLT